MHKPSYLVLVTVFLPSIALLTAQAAAPDKTLTITVTGAFGPNLNNGPDPVGGDGKSGTITIKASESLKPVKKTAHSATYKLPAGAIDAVIAGVHFHSKTPSRLTYHLRSSRPDAISIRGTFRIDHVNAKIVGVADLASGSLSRAAFRHPVAFSPSPQNLTPGTTYPGPGSYVSYSVLGELTVLGLTGTASDSAATN
jgi:hypothetical protein